MRKITVTTLIIVGVILGGTFLLLRGKHGQQPAPQASPALTRGNSDMRVTPPAETSPAEATLAATVVYEKDGFSPPEVVIRSGGKINWVNRSDKEVQIGANPHPLHTGNREVSGGEFVLSLLPGKVKSVILTEAGSFGYHNHLRPTEGGVIIVR